MSHSGGLAIRERCFLCGSCVEENCHPPRPPIVHAPMNKPISSSIDDYDRKEISDVLFDMVMT